MTETPDPFATAFVEPDPEQSAEQRAEEEAEAMARQRATVERLISSRLRDAISAKENSGIEQIWIDDEDQYNGFDAMNPPIVGATGIKDQAEQARTQSQRSSVFLNITKPKTDTAVSRVQEMLLPHDDRPWACEPTPVPEFEKAAKGKDQTPMTLGDGTQATAEQVAKAKIEEARQAAKRMSDQIEDWHVEGNVYAELRKVIRDAGRIGSGVIKGPFPVMRKDKKYAASKAGFVLTVLERLAPTSKKVDPWDLFPDPSCGENIHHGAYLFERDFMTGRRLRELAKLPDYDTDALAAILKEGPQRRSRSDRYMREKPGETPDFDTGTFEVFYYYGDLPPEDIIAGGFVVQGMTHDEQGEALPADSQDLQKALQLTTVPIVATMVNYKVVRVSMNPLETGDFPFDVFPWEPVDGQPWGRGIPRKMAVAQKMLNASVRALLENAGMSAGPQLVVAKGVIEPWDKNYTVQGRKGWSFTPNEVIDDVRKAFASVEIPSAQPQLQAIIQFALQMADELSNLPMLMQGAIGSAPDTVGGMAMLQANAASPLKTIAKQADDSLFEPHIKRYYAWGMQDPAVPNDAKGDMQCKARGASALVQRDAAAQFLPNLLPLSKDPAYGLDPEKVATEVIRSQRSNPADLQLDDQQKQAMQEQQGQEPQDPRIQAAQIQADQRREQVQTEMQDHEAERAHQAALKQLDFQIQAMEFAGQKEISFEQLKAMLAKVAIDSRTKQSLQEREMAFAQGPGDGRGL